MISRSIGTTCAFAPPRISVASPSSGRKAHLAPLSSRTQRRFNLIGALREAGPHKRRNKARLGCRRFVTDTGILVLHEESHQLPLVDLQVSLRTGSVHDAAGLEGLSRMTATMIRMGTRRMSAQVVEERIDRLGAQLSIQCAPSCVHFHGAVVQRNLEPFMALLGELLKKPAWRRADLDFVKRETIAEIVEAADNDSVLAGRHFRRFALGDHPYGRSVIGSRDSVSAVRREDVKRYYAQHFVTKNLVVGAAGAVDAWTLCDLVDRHLGGLPAGRPLRDRVPAPRLPRGRRVLIVDKPERTQTQILIGTLGARTSDPDYFPFIVANTVFGGTFTARLMNEIRSKRGWSYGAGSRQSNDRRRDLWTMWASPAVRDTVACIELQLSMLEALVEKGISSSELSFAKSYLMKSHAFDIDTPAKRLGQCMDAELFSLPPDFYLQFVQRVRAVRRKQANDALAKRLSVRDLAIVVVATAEDVKNGLAALPGVTEVQVVPFDAMP